MSLFTHNGHHDFQNGGYRRGLRLERVQPLLQLLLPFIARRGRVELGQRRPKLLHGETHRATEVLLPFDQGGIRAGCRFWYPPRPASPLDAGVTELVAALLDNDTAVMAAMGNRRSEDGWISSLKAVVRENPGTEVDQGVFYVSWLTFKQSTAESPEPQQQHSVVQRCVVACWGAETVGCR